MRIDLFAVWFMNGLLGQPAEQSTVFAMVPSATPPAPDSARAVVMTAATAAATRYSEGVN
jgi:hypothetical protein